MFVSIAFVAILFLSEGSFALKCIGLDKEECLKSFYAMSSDGDVGCRWDAAVGCFEMGCPTVQTSICEYLPKDTMQCKVMDLEPPSNNIIPEKYFSENGISQSEICMGVCPQRLDVVFLVDTALSNAERDAEHLQNSLIRAIDKSLKVSEKRNEMGRNDEGTEFALISFGKKGEGAKVEFGFGEYETIADYYGAVKASIPSSVNGESFSDYSSALFEAYSLFEDDKNARKDAQRIVILLSENIPTSTAKPCTNHPTLVEDFENRGIELFVVLIDDPKNPSSISTEEAGVECFVSEKVGRAVKVEDFALDLFTYPLAYAMSQNTCPPSTPSFHGL